jgi:hypothetical protein
MRTVAFTLIVLLSLLGATVAVSLWTWHELHAVDIGFHGLVALALGASVTFVLGAGLMALVFYSSRRGYDDRAHEADPLRARTRYEP